MQEIEPKPSPSKVLGLLLVPSAAKPDPFLLVEPNYGPKMWVELVLRIENGFNRVELASIGFKIRFNPIMYLMNPN